ncbi:MAG: sulfatase-like hydrolase/transferase [Verrucomicrobiota bacterium]
MSSKLLIKLDLEHYRVWMEDQKVDFTKWFPDETGVHDHAQTGSWNISEQYHDTTWITNEALSHLESIPNDEPWFSWVSYNDPHEPFVCPEPWFSQVDTDALPMREGYREGEFADKPFFYSEVYESPGSGWSESWRDSSGHDVPCAYSRKDLSGKEREAMQATLGMVAMIDHHVGRLIDHLEATGLAENTLIIFTSDHGELHGQHGLWHKGLFAYEEVQRIPFLAWGPGLIRRPSGSGALVNLVDLPKTFLSLAGLPIPQSIQGCDLTPILTGQCDTVRDATTVELQATQKVYQLTLITETHKLVVYRNQDYGELYDLEKDPDQYVNLWALPDCAGTKSELLLKLAQTRLKEEGHTHPRKAYA